MHEQDLITEISLLVRQNNRNKATKLIQKLKLLRPLDDHLRLTLSMWYLTLGNSQRAISILGHELSSGELMAANVGTFKIQLRLAYLYTSVGAYNSASRVLANLQKPIVRLGKTKEELLLKGQFYRYQGSLYLTRYQYQLAREAYQKAIPLYEAGHDSYNKVLAQFGLADALEGCGDTQLAVALAREIEQGSDKDLREIAKIAIGEYQLRVGKIAAAEKNFNQVLAAGKINIKDKGYLLKWLGVLHLLKKNNESAKKYLKQAQHIFAKQIKNPASLIEVLFWQTHVLAGCEKRDVYRTVATHPIQHPLGAFWGLPLNFESPQQMHPWHQRLWKLYRSGKLRPVSFGALIQTTQNTTYDTWVLQEGKLEKLVYLQNISSILLGRYSIIDFVSGATKLLQKWETLSAMLLQLLLALAAAGPLGLRNWALIDTLYGMQQSDPESLILRLEELVKKARQAGFLIERKGHFYYWPLPKNTVVLLPMTLKSQGPLFLMNALFKEWTRQEVQNFWDIPERTAQQWIKEAMENKQVRLKPGPPTRPVIYCGVSHF